MLVEPAVHICFHCEQTMLIVHSNISRSQPVSPHVGIINVNLYYISDTHKLYQKYMIDKV